MRADQATSDTSRHSGASRKIYEPPGFQLDLANHDVRLVSALRTRPPATALAKVSYVRAINLREWRVSRRR
jgi:hypothetical protein